MTRKKMAHPRKASQKSTAMNSNFSTKIRLKLFAFAHAQIHLFKMGGIP